MLNVPIQEYLTHTPMGQKHTEYKQRKPSRFRSDLYKYLLLLGCTAALLFGSTLVSRQQSAQAANPGAGNACTWYTVRYGNTLSGIARSYRTTAFTLGRVNYIANINLIFIGQRLCIPYHVGGGNGGGQSTSGGGSLGILSNGYVRWYAYNALQWSSRGQVSALLRQVAARYGLPANLVLAIAWQESGWTQHVIARDGGIGVMQLMPYTAMGINSGTGIRRDPYKLWDNLNLGATYLRWLWINFRGNLAKVISAYNEGGWAVIHRGIFNWNYVNNVMYLMRVLR